METPPEVSVKGTMRDAILKELADQRVEMVRMALRSALNLIQTAEDKAEAEKLVRKLLDKYQ